jgi:hypothetical protein
VTLEQIFEHCKKIADGKRHDYTSTTNRHENFERVALVQSWFKSDIDKPYVVLIITKIARLAALLDAKEPRNESIEDTFFDLVNYCALWADMRTESVVKPPQCLALLKHAPNELHGEWTEACQLSLGHPEKRHKGIQSEWY